MHIVNHTTTNPDYGPIESVVPYKGDNLCHILIQRVPCIFYYLFPSNYLNEYKKWYDTSFKFVLTFADIYFQVTWCFSSGLENSIYIKSSNSIHITMMQYKYIDSLSRNTYFQE
jgi:hypothetical protein